MSSISRASSPAPIGVAQEDWDDVDSPELTDDELSQLRPAREMPAEVYAQLTKRGRGRPKAENAKVNVTLRLDPRLVDAYKALGDGWQVRMQEVLARGLEPAKPVPQLEAFALFGPSSVIKHPPLGVPCPPLVGVTGVSGVETFRVVPAADLNTPTRRSYKVKIVRGTLCYFEKEAAGKKGAQPKRPKRPDGKKGTPKTLGRS